MHFNTQNLPEAVKAMPKGAQKAWMDKANATMKAHPDDEKGAMAAAMAGVKAMYEQDDKGAWRAKQDVSLEQIRDMLWSALQAKNEHAYVRDVFPAYLIYRDETTEKFYKISWSILDGAVQLGAEATEVQLCWEPMEMQVGQDVFSEQSLAMRIGQSLDPEGAAWEVTICETGATLSGYYITDDSQRAGAALFEGTDVNLYELPTGVTHVPESLFDAKQLLVKNKVGWIDGVKHVAGRGLMGTLHFLDSAKWMGRNILAAMQQGQKVYGLSWDALIRGAMAVIDNKTLIRIDEFKRVDSVDIVTRPAAGGKFNRAVAGMPAQIKEDKMREKLLLLIKEKRPELLAGKDEATITDQEVEGLARMAMEVPAPAAGEVATKDDLAIFRCSMDLRDRLAEPGLGLPEPAKARIKKTFEGRAFQAADLDQAIKDEKDYLASVSASQPQGAGVPASGIVVGLGSFDRACMALDRTFGLTGGNMTALARMSRLDNRPYFEDMRAVQDYSDFDQVPAFHGLREAYAYFTGDHEVTGRFNRKNLPAELRAAMDITSATFSYVLGNTLGRRLVSLYREYNFGEDILISTRKPVRDFRTQEAVLVGGFGDLADVDPEAADYSEIGGVTDEESTYAIGQKGNILTITRKTIINDDLSIIIRLVSGLARAARRTHAKYVWNFWINNANCSDGTAWFTGGHGNLVAGALTHAAALTGYIALSKMTEKDSGERLGLLADPSVKPNLIGPVDLMATIQKIATEEFYYTANDLTTKVPNPLANKVNPVLCPLLTDTTDWGLLLPPSLVDIVEMGYLNGRTDPELFVADTPQSEQVFIADKIRHKIRHEYAGAVVDFRSGYKSEV